MLVKPSSQASEQARGVKSVPLTPERLRRCTDLSLLTFSTTAEIATVESMLGQQRALDAIVLGTRIEKPGYNLFVIGPPNARMRESVRTFLENEARQKSSPCDWIYVNNFAAPHKPAAIPLPTGGATAFRDAMDGLIDNLTTGLPAVFESEEYRTRRGAADDRFRKKQAEAFAGLRDKAAQRQVVIVHTPFGFALAPERNGKVVAPDEFHTWPDAEKKQAQDAIAALEKELEHIIQQTPQWDKERRDEIRTLNRESANIAVRHFIDDVKQQFADVQRIPDYLEAVRGDLVDNVGMFLGKEKQDEDSHEIAAQTDALFNRYRVNVFVTQGTVGSGAPVIEETHPTLGNLVGRIEYAVREGMLISNFLLIKPGALHRANGGYLFVDIRNLLSEPFSWTALKRVLLQQSITIEDVARFVGLTNTISLEPDPIPMTAKVVLFGERLLYFLLAALDPDLEQHFKILADFENDFQRTSENEVLMARLIATMANQGNLRPFEREAVAKVIEQAARLADHAGKLSLLTDRLRNLLTEADFCAAEARREIVSCADVERAIEQRIRRMARVRDRMLEGVLEKVKLIDTEGVRVGQVNGLSVLDLAGFAFGTAHRITCRVRPGVGKVIDIEREVELGGPVHSKGVLILSGFLAGRYALQTLMAVQATLVFEQSYSAVEGDSASSAELCALLSAIADLPLRQDLAVTGSVNQNGEIQAISGVNEKIEGFFDICKARGLSGTQGVIIPAANIQHLMLRQDVVDACIAGKFAVYAITTIDEAMALLTGYGAGERGTDGLYAARSVNQLVEERLCAFASIQRRYRQASAITGDQTDG
jgi:lon-related putative ATP-dependent protease